MNRNRCPLVALVAILFAVSAPATFAQSGQIALTVDATLASEKIVRTRQSIPVKPGPFTLYYPKWIPGEHGPDGPIGNLTGLKFTANGKTIPWTARPARQLHVSRRRACGRGSSRCRLRLYRAGSGGFATSAASATDKLLVIEWNQNVLYPAGPPANQIIFKPTLILPDGWKFGTPQHVENQSGNQVSLRASIARAPRRFARDHRPVLSRDRHYSAGRARSITNLTSLPTAKSRST